MSTPQTKRPLSLIIIAGIFILAGVAAAVECVGALLHGYLSVNLGFLLLFIGWGLWRLRPAAREWAMAVVVLGGFGLVLGLIGLFSGAGEVRFAGEVVAGWRRWLVISCCMGLLAVVLVWMWRVLNRRDVKRLFWGCNVELLTAPNGSPTESHANSGVVEGPPSVN